MTEDEVQEKKAVCGIVMPISAIDGCSEAHWSEVHDILNEAIDDAGFEPNLVSNADDVGIIQKRIIQNLYDNPIVVCDVSAKNPNVMFELGMRLAFDRPTIIVKDDKTSYSFDTSPIEHIEYPRDLRFSKIIEFKELLSDKIRNTHEKSSSDKTYTTFLKHFGEFKVAKIDKKEVSGQEFIIEELKNLRAEMGKLGTNNMRKLPRPDAPGGVLDFCLSPLSQSEMNSIFESPLDLPVTRVELRDFGDHKHLWLFPQAKSDEPDIITALKTQFPRIRQRSRPAKRIRPTALSQAKNT